MAPQQRLAFAMQSSMPVEYLQRLETIAQMVGIPLNGGRVTPAPEGMPTGPDGDDDGEEEDEGEGEAGEGEGAGKAAKAPRGAPSATAGMADFSGLEGGMGFPGEGAGFGEGLEGLEGREGEEGPKPTVRDLAELTMERAQTFGTSAAFYLGIPLILLIAAGRRHMGIGELVGALMRFPFMD
jgi:hypothetical protein